MAKYFGKLGIGTDEEVRPGIFKKSIKEVECYGDIIEVRRRLETSSSVNDSLNVSIQLSIVCDPFVKMHVKDIIYASYMDYLWKVTDIVFEFPRLKLSLGGIYHANPAGASDDFDRLNW